MKDITQKLIELLKKGYCTSQITKIAKTIKEPPTTIHYNLKKLEKDGIIKTYKAIFNYKKIDEVYCTYVLVNLLHEKYGFVKVVSITLLKQIKTEFVEL